MSCHHPYPWPWIFCPWCTRRAYLTTISIWLEVCCHQFYNSTSIPLFHLDNYLLSDGLWKDCLSFVLRYLDTNQSNYLCGRPAAPELSFKELTLKLTFLLSLLSGQRCQIIKYSTTDNMELTTDKSIFQITDKVKQTRIGTHIPPLSIVADPKDKKLCITSHLQEYLKRLPLERTVSNCF